MEDEVDVERLYNPRLWPRTNEVRKAFDRCAARVRRFKDEDGVGIVDPGISLRPEERDLLLRSAAMLPGSGAFDSRAATAGDLPDPRSVRHTHVAAVDIVAWDDPVRAMLYAAVQEAAHAALIKGGLDEEKITESILATFGGTLATFETAYGDSGCKLPPGRFLHACTASMQANADELGADLAIVVGTNVLGAARYRLVLLQAKRMGSRCTADVGHNEGRQLDELMSSGMGFYLFYPEPIAASARQMRLGADSDEVARSFRFHVAHHSGMMSPGFPSAADL